MSGEGVAGLLKQAEGLMKSDLKGALVLLDSALATARQSGSEMDIAMVADELSRAWSRRKSSSRSLYYAVQSTEVAPERKASWCTLAKTCELLAARVRGEDKRQRARLLYRCAAKAFKKAAALGKDPEDKRWLLELARDAEANAR
jgi:hypothetical protein